MTDDQRRTALARAIHANRYQDVEQLVAADVDVNRRFNSHLTPLMVACGLGLTGVAQQPCGQRRLAWQNSC